MRTILTLGVAAVLALPALAADEAKQPANDAEFLVACSQCCNAQIQFNKLGYRQASDPKVKEFANDLVKAHDKMAGMLSERAKNQKVAVLADLTKAQREEYDRLADRKGSDFDRAYLDWVVKSHEKALKMCESYSSKAEGELKTCAADCAAGFKDHLAKAKELLSQLK